MRYNLQQGVVRKIKNGVINTTLSAVLLISGLGGSLPLFLSQKAAAAAVPGTVEITNIIELRNAIENQHDGQTWTINAGDYGIDRFNDITAGGQTGWYLPITANNLTINGVGNPTLFGQEYSANGNWSSQDLIAVFGNNVTISGLTLMPKIDANKTIEVLGNNFTLENTTIAPNTRATSAYDNIASPEDKAFAQQWGGSIYFNHAGNHTLENVTINNGGISFRYSPSGTHVTFNNVNIINSTNDDFTNAYRYSTGFANPGTGIVGAPQVTYNVSSTLNNLDSVLAGAQNGDTVNINSDLITSKQITITKALTVNGNGHAILPTFSKTDNGNNSAIGIQSNGVAINNLTVNGVSGTNLHGINAVNATATLDNVTVKNNNRDGLVVNASNITVTDVTTSDNGWDGIDVDKTGAILTVNGTSQHAETGNAIYIDDTTTGAKVIDTTNQYFVSHPNKNPNDRAYNLDHSNLVVDVTYPTNNSVISTPNNKLIVKGNFSATLNGANYIQTQLVYKGNDKGVITKYGAITNGTFAEFDTTGLPDGSEYYIAVTGTDAAGNVSTRHIVNFTLDNSAPEGVATYTGGNKLGDVIYLKSINDLNFNAVLTDTLGLEHTSYAVWKADSNFGNRTLFCGNWNHAVTSVDISGTSASINGSVKDCSPTGNWSNGNYVIMHVVYDAAGNLVYFNNPYPGQKFVIDNTAPTVTLLSPSPADGQHVRGTITIKANYEDAYGLQRIFAGIHGQSWCLDNPAAPANGEYSCTFDTTTLADGEYYIRTEAIDQAGNDTPFDMTNTNLMRRIVVDNHAPVVSDVHISNPVHGTAEIRATITDPSGVNLNPRYTFVRFAHGQDTAHTDSKSANATLTLVPGTTNQYMATIDTTKFVENGYSGTYWLYFRVQDNLGSAAGNDNTRGIVVDNARPHAHITSPADNSYNTTGSLTIEGTASDGQAGISHVNIYVSKVTPPDANGKTFGGYVVENQSASYDQNTGTFTYDVPTSLMDGKYAIKAVAFDAAGNSQFASTVNITVDTINPSVATVMSKTVINKQTTSDPTVTINATDTGSGIGYVQYKVMDDTGSTLLGWVTISNGAATPVNGLLDLNDGSYTLRARAFDNAGNKKSGSDVAFTIDRIAPTLKISPSTGTDNTPTITGTTSDDSDTVIVTINGHDYTAVVASDGTWGAEVSDALPANTYTASAISTDQAGNSTTKTASVEVTETVTTGGTTTTVTPNTTGTNGLVAGRGGAFTAVDGQVLGATTTDGNATDTTTQDNKGEVKGDSVELTTDTKDASKDNGNFLGLGWWWLLVLGALAAFLLFLFRRSDSDSKEA